MIEMHTQPCRFLLPRRRQSSTTTGPSFELQLIIRSKRELKEIWRSQCSQPKPSGSIVASAFLLRSGRYWPYDSTNRELDLLPNNHQQAESSTGCQSRAK